MGYWMLLHFLEFSFDLLRLRRQSDLEKELEILLLRQQLRIVERKQQHAPRIPRFQKLFLALLAQRLRSVSETGRAKLSEVSLLFKPETLLKWHWEAVRRKWRYRRKAEAGRPRTENEVERLIVRLAQENPRWGYSKLTDELLKLGIQIGETTLRDILARHGIPPAPERSRKGSSWRTFLNHYQHQLLACDFFTVETLTLQTLYVLFFIHHATRQVYLAGCTAHPNSAWVSQQARQMLWQLEEAQTSVAFLIHDNDKKFSQAFETVFESENVAMIRTPFRAPNANAIAERWVRSVREECLDRLIILNAPHLRAVLKEYCDYYNARRPHQGLKSATPIPLPQPDLDGSIRCRKVLGGIIHDYFREAA